MTVSSGTGSDAQAAPALPETHADPSIWSYLVTIVRRPGLIVGLPIVFAVAVGTLNLLRTREYVAFASFVPQGVSGLQSSVGQLASQFGLVAPQASASSPQFYADLLLSRDVLRSVITSQYSVAGAGGFRGSLFDYFGMGGRDPERSFTDAVPKFLSLVDVSADKATGIVRLQVRSRFADLSRQIARRFLIEVISFNQRRRQTTGQAESEFVQERLQDSRRALVEAENALAGFYQRNRRVADSPQLIAEEARLQRQVTLNQQVYVALYQSLQASRLEAARNTPVITEVDRPESYVQRRARGTVRNTFLGLLGGVVVALLLVFGGEYIASTIAASPAEYAEFVALRSRFLRLVRLSSAGRLRQRR